MKIGSIEIDEWLDTSNELAMVIYGCYGASPDYINKDQAKEIITHLTKVFKLEEKL